MVRESPSVYLSLSPQVWTYKHVSPCLACSIASTWVLEIKLGPCTWVASTLPTELSPQPAPRFKAIIKIWWDMEGLWHTFWHFNHTQNCCPTCPYAPYPDPLLLTRVFTHWLQKWELPQDAVYGSGCGFSCKIWMYIPRQIHEEFPWISSSWIIAAFRFSRHRLINVRTCYVCTFMRLCITGGRAQG